MTNPQPIDQLPVGPRIPLQFLDVVPELLVDGTPRWMTDGITFSGHPLSYQLSVGATGCDQPWRTDPERSCLTYSTQLPFNVWDAMRLSVSNWLSLGITSNDELRAHFERLLSATYASELLTAAGSGGESLSGNAVAPADVPFGSAATPLWNAIAILESSLAGVLRGGAGVIHLTPGLFSVAATQGIITRGSGGWMTHLGNAVISDAGYVNAPSPGVANASAAGEDWVYATGPVWRLSTPINIRGGTFEAGTFMPSINKVDKMTETLGLIAFDPDCVFSVLAAYALEV